ncbi:unnamed protein product, partial [Ixodes persulcatus]
NEPGNKSNTRAPQHNINTTQNHGPEDKMRTKVLCHLRCHHDRSWVPHTQTASRGICQTYFSLITTSKPGATRWHQTHHRNLSRQKQRTRNFLRTLHLICMALRMKPARGPYGSSNVENCLFVRSLTHSLTVLPQFQALFHGGAGASGHGGKRSRGGGRYPPPDARYECAPATPQHPRRRRYNRRPRALQADCGRQQSEPRVQGRLKDYSLSRWQCASCS